MDIDLINEVGKEFKKRFDHCPITKILTIEASGIGIACIAAQYFHVPVVFAKKAQSVNLDGEMYTTKVESFTHKKVYDVILSKKFLGPEDHVLLIDDFLANGCALLGLIDIVKKSGATLEGAGIVTEKGFQSGGQTSVTWVSIWNPLLSLIPLLMANLLSVNKIYHKKILLETYIHCFREYFYFYHSQIMISFLIYASAPFSAFSEGVGVTVSSGVGVPEISVFFLFR